MSKADSLTQPQINRVLTTCQLLPHGEAKRCALVLSHSALRVTEIALLQTKHIVFPSGVIREEVALPAKICKHLKPRVIWLSNPKTRQIIQEWINYRKTKSWAVTKSNDYQGLNPESRFLLNNRGRSYALQPKPRVMLDGEVKTYWACDSLEQTFRKLYARCGLHNASSHSGRKSFVTNAIIRGESLEKMARILGHSSTETTLKYVVIQRDRLREMCSIDWI